MKVLVESNAELVPKKMHTSGAAKPGQQAETTRKANNETIFEGYMVKHDLPDNDKPPGSTVEEHMEASPTDAQLRQEVVDTGDEELDEVITGYKKDSRYDDSPRTAKFVQALISMICAWRLDKKNVITVYALTTKEFKEVITKFRCDTQGGNEGLCQNYMNSKM
jgi:hypothetical protein